MNEENLTVSWGLPSQLSDNLKEYVVQYKQECSQDQAFDWIKVNKSQRTAFFKGLFDVDTLISMPKICFLFFFKLQGLLGSCGCAVVGLVLPAFTRMCASTYRSIQKVHTVPSVTVHSIERR